MRHLYLAGLDVGFQQDYTALLIVDAALSHEQTVYTPLFLHRLPLPTTAPDVLTLVRDQLVQSPAWRTSRDQLLVDITGAGTPIGHQIRSMRLDPIGIWSHSGVGATRVDGRWNVSKQDLVNSAKLVVEQHRFQLDPSMPLADVMLHELEFYRGLQSQTTGHMTYSAWREKDHDDLVFCLAMVCWWGELLARSMPLDVDLSRAFMPMPRTFTRSPDRAQRIRRPQRLSADILEEEPRAMDWDDLKDAAARGELDLHPRPPQP